MTIIEEPLTWKWQPEKRKSTEYFVIHHSAGTGSVQEIHALHQSNGWTGIGYHFYIRKTGRIYRGRPEDRVGTHTSGHNARSIGICFEGNFEKDAMGDTQYQAGVELLETLIDRYGDLPVYRHRDLNATACPGKYFPFDQMKEDACMTQERFNQMADAWLESLAKKDPGSWSKESREWAVANGIFKGTGDGFAWCRPMTREEYAELEYRQRA